MHTVLYSLFRLHNYEETCLLLFSAFYGREITCLKSSDQHDVE